MPLSSAQLGGVSHLRLRPCLMQNFTVLQWLIQVCLSVKNLLITNLVLLNKQKGLSFSTYRIFSISEDQILSQLSSSLSQLEHSIVAM